RSPVSLVPASRRHLPHTYERRGTCATAFGVLGVLDGQAAASAALRATHSATRLRGGRVVLDLAAPRAGLHAPALDEVLEALQVALAPPVDHAQRIADLFLHPLGLVVHLHH